MIIYLLYWNNIKKIQLIGINKKNYKCYILEKFLRRVRENWRETSTWEFEIINTRQQLDHKETVGPVFSRIEGDNLPEDDRLIFTSNQFHSKMEQRLQMKSKTRLFNQRGIFQQGSKEAMSINCYDTPDQIRTGVAGSKVLHD
jgi:tRNA/tmRNA/rRNA uracil-C5-methylase (TrmA/RlmC/RlmD family)